jgi:ribosomal-protein-alanine N-acetyltransferase
MDIETKRLVIRKFKKEDFEDFFEYISDEETVKFEPYKPMSTEEAKESLEWKISSDEMFAAVEKSSGKVIGNVYFGKSDYDSAELGYVFNKNFWHMGYAKEACEAVLKEAFLGGTHRVFAECDPKNEASWRLLEALGFKREGYFRQNVYFWKDENGNPVWKDTFLYAKLSTDGDF